MLDISENRHGLTYNHIWFAERPSLARAFAPVIYMQCRHKGPALGYRSRVFHTVLLDLTADADTLLRNMSHTTSYEIRRARRDEVAIRPVDSMAEFISFYNEFAASKGLSRLEPGDLFGWGHKTLAFAAMMDGEPIAMHSYLVDRTTGRARLRYSASHFRSLHDSNHRNAIGRANRYLHYAAMLHFKEAGLTTYDMGGFAKDTTDPEMAAINRFKDGFGGVVVREDHFFSLPMHALQIAKRSLARWWPVASFKA